MGELALRDRVDRDRLLALASELIRCESVNPPGDERAAADVVARQLEDVGARSIETIESASDRVSVTARWGRAGGRVLAWNGHLDVVPAGDADGWRHSPFGAAVEDGRLWGRGAADMKGAVAAVLEALVMLGRGGFVPRGELALSFVADEETGGEHGTGYLARHGLLPVADAAICGEPTGLHVAIAARGRLWIDIMVTGRSAHASQPERGDNALERMRRVLSALDRVELPREKHPLLGHATLTPTVIRGGDSPNTVPDRCMLSIDRRFLPTEDVDQVRRQLMTALDSLSEDDRSNICATENACFEASETDVASEIVAIAQDATERATGMRAQIQGMPGSTDARFFVAAGIPTVIYGPGELSSAHSVDESIAVADLVDGAAAYAAVIQRFLS